MSNLNFNTKRRWQWPAIIAGLIVFVSAVAATGLSAPRPARLYPSPAFAVAATLGGFGLTAVLLGWLSLTGKLRRPDERELTLNRLGSSGAWTLLHATFTLWAAVGITFGFFHRLSARLDTGDLIFVGIPSLAYLVALWVAAWPAVKKPKTRPESRKAIDRLAREEK